MIWTAFLNNSVTLKPTTFKTFVISWGINMNDYPHLLLERKDILNTLSYLKEKKEKASNEKKRRERIRELNEELKVIDLLISVFYPEKVAKV